MRLLAVILLLAFAVTSAEDHADDSILEAYAARPECMTMLSRVYYATSEGAGDEMMLAKFGAKQLLRQWASVASGREIIWQDSRWGMICDPNGAVLERLNQINLVRLATSAELAFMAQLREHHEHDQDVSPAWMLERKHLERVVNDENASVPVPGQGWIWQDYVLLLAGIPLVLALVGISAWAFLLHRRSQS